jgi:RNA polymerase sigma-70 factor (ECF subfamily)
LTQDRAEELLAIPDSRGRQELLGRFLMEWRPRLRTMVLLRLDPRLKMRVDPSDVIQEAFLEISKRLGEFLRTRPMPLYLWVRRMTGQSILGVHRHHLGREARDPRKEVALEHHWIPEASSEVLAAHLVKEERTPLDEAVRAERKARVQAALESMPPLDREVLALRHFEQLSNAEVARTLELTESGASKRYFRALERLRKSLGRTGRRGREDWL